MQALYLSNTQVSDLRPLSGLSGLQALYLSNTQVSDLRLLSGLSGLQALYLSNTQVSDLRPLSGLSGLQALELSHTQVSDLRPLSGLSGLKLLELSDTQVSDLRPLSGLSGLYYLNLSNTRVSDLKPLLGLVRKGLDIGDNYPRHEILLDVDNCINPPPAIIKMGRVAFINWFAQMELQGEATMLEGRLVIAGESKAGKTTLFRKLLDETIPVPDHLQKSTHGIRIAYNRPFGHSLINEQIQGHIWDFGGQQVQTYLHQYFFARENLVVLVTDLRDETTRFDYWFEIISRLCSGSEVIVAGNLHGLHTATPQFNLQQYQQRFPGLRLRYVQVNLAESDARWALLKEEIARGLSGLKVVNQTVPALWKQVSQVLLKEKEKQPFISWEGYQAICEEKGITGEDFQQLLAGYLSSLGYIAYFDDPGLSNTVFLNPQWMIDGLYEVLRDTSYDSNYPGRFEKAHLNKLWQHKGYKKTERNLLLSLLLKDRFEVCYALEGTGYLLAPLFLTNLTKEVDTTRLPEQYYTLRFGFPFMPFGFFSRVIVRLSNLIWENHVWLTGVWLKDTNNCHAFLNQFKDATTGAEVIEITIYGAQYERIKLLEKVRHEILQVQERLFKNLIVEELIPCPCNDCRKEQKPEYHMRKRLDTLLSKQKTYAQCKYGSETPILQLLNAVISEQALTDYLKQKGMADEKIKIEVNPVFHNENKPQFKQEMHTEVATHVQINLQLIMDFKETLEMVREDLETEAKVKEAFKKEELEELQADLAKAEQALQACKENQAEPSIKIKSRLKQFGEALIDENSNLRKALKFLKQGKDYGITVARAYNTIAENFGLPVVPKLALSALEKL